MKRILIAILALAMVIGLQPQARAANTDSNAFWSFLFHNQDPRLTAAGIGVGAGAGVASYLMTKKHGYPPVRHVSYGAAFGVTTFGCAVLYPMVATVLINRPLTYREAYIGVAECIVPVLGGWFVDTYLPHNKLYDTVQAR
jgi:hypothetical protein